MSVAMVVRDGGLVVRDGRLRMRETEVTTSEDLGEGSDMIGISLCSIG